MELIRKAVELAMMLLTPDEIEQNRDEIVELAMDVWEYIDPTPDLDVDDRIVEAVIEWLVDFLSTRN